AGDTTPVPGADRRRGSLPRHRLLRSPAVGHRSLLRGGPAADGRAGARRPGRARGAHLGLRHGPRAGDPPPGRGDPAGAAAQRAAGGHHRALARAGATERDGRRPGDHPGPGDAGHGLHLRVPDADRRLVHVPRTRRHAARSWALRPPGRRAAPRGAVLRPRVHPDARRLARRAGRPRRARRAGRRRARDGCGRPRPGGRRLVRRPLVPVAAGQRAPTGGPAGAGGAAGRPGAAAGHEHRRGHRLPVRRRRPPADRHPRRRDAGGTRRGGRPAAGHGRALRRPGRRRAARRGVAGGRAVRGTRRLGPGPAPLRRQPGVGRPGGRRAAGRAGRPAGLLRGARGPGTAVPARRGARPPLRPHPLGHPDRRAELPRRRPAGGDRGPVGAVHDAQHQREVAPHAPARAPLPGAHGVRTRAGEGHRRRPGARRRGDLRLPRHQPWAVAVPLPQPPSHGGRHAPAGGVRAPAV
ncbi:MAG: Multicopper oxidase, partial [uncultured Blastococcus sp.]